MLTLNTTSLDRIPDSVMQLAGRLVDFGRAAADADPDDVAAMLNQVFRPETRQHLAAVMVEIDDEVNKAVERTVRMIAEQCARSDVSAREIGRVLLETLAEVHAEAGVN